MRCLLIEPQNLKFKTCFSILFRYIENNDNDVDVDDDDDDTSYISMENSNFQRHFFSMRNHAL